jgi:small-conductance mechanosensitive channel
MHPAARYIIDTTPLPARQQGAITIIDLAISGDHSVEFANIFEELGIQDVLSYKVFSLQNTAITVGNLIIVVVILLIAYVVSKLVQRALTKALGDETAEQRAARKTTNRLVHYAMMLIGLGIGLGTMGINLSALFAAGAVFAVGIGFAVQNILENFFSGLVLMFDRSIRPGDVIDIEGEITRVRDIRVRTTTVTNLDGEEYIVPNSKLAQSTVKNLSGPTRGHRVRASVGVHYDSDLDVVFETLKKTADNYEGRDESRETLVLLQEFGSSSVNFDVFIWIRSAWTTPRDRSQLMKMVWDALEEAGVVIAYPQIDVHFDDEFVSRLAYKEGASTRKPSGKKEDGDDGAEETAEASDDSESTSDEEDVSSDESNGRK